MIFKAGEFQICVCRHAYPINCEINFKDNVIAMVTHRDLNDLHYVLEKAMREAKAALPENLKHEVII